MTTLYNCKHAGDEYRITKFDNDMHVVSSYLCTFTECDCPAGVRDICRHRIMLNKFIGRNAVDTAWFYDYDRDGWVQSDLGEALSESVEDDHAGSVDTAGTATGTATASGDTFEDAVKTAVEVAKANGATVNSKIASFRRGL